MEHKKILIVEDELIESQSMVFTLTKKGYNCKAVTAGEEAIETISSYKPDIILMDIGLSGKIDGISTAGIIRQQYISPIIFITDQKNSQIFQQARGTHPQNFISKPYTDDALTCAIELALDQPALYRAPDGCTPLGDRVSDGIFVLADGKHEKVLFKDILYLEANGAYTNMYCSHGKTYLISLSSNNVETQLAYPGMVRTSRFHCVNIHRVDGIKNDELIVEKKVIPVTKTYKENVMNRIKKIGHQK